MLSSRPMRFVLCPIAKKKKHLSVRTNETWLGINEGVTDGGLEFVTGGDPDLDTGFFEVRLALAP